MFELFFGWIRDLSVYLITAAALLYAVPGEEYRKYIRFYSGLVLVLLLITPVIKIFGMESTFSEIRRDLEEEMRITEEKMSEQEKTFDFLVTDTSGEQGIAGDEIETKGFMDNRELTEGTINKDRRMIVEEIRIGE